MWQKCFLKHDSPWYSWGIQRCCYKYSFWKAQILFLLGYSCSEIVALINSVNFLNPLGHWWMWSPHHVSVGWPWPCGQWDLILFSFTSCVKLLQDQGDGVPRSPGWRSRISSPEAERALLFNSVTLISSVQYRMVHRGLRLFSLHPAWLCDSNGLIGPIKTQGLIFVFEVNEPIEEKIKDFLLIEGNQMSNSKIDFFGKALY